LCVFPDRARNDVSRGEVAEHVPPGHDARTARRDEMRARTAQGLSEKRQRIHINTQRRRMELHELERGSARADRHRHPIAGCVLAVGREAVQSANTAGREHRLACVDDRRAAPCIDYLRSRNTPA
jgi:hypothetical protein